jgi:hypothetical protein
LEDAEIAINQADGKLYYHTVAGGVSPFASVPSAHKATHATGGSDALSAADIGALTQTTADSRYVGLAGGAMTGALTISGNAVVVTTDSRLSDARTPLSHAHGNLTNAGAIGTTASLPIITTTAGVLTTGAFGTASGSFCQGNDSRLSDARTPTSHTHGNITNAGAIGTAASLPIITTTSGVLATGAFGTTSGSFCQGNDSRLSDARTPLAHTQAASTITDFSTEAGKYGPVTSVNGLTGAVTISSGSSLSDGDKGDITVSSSGAAWTIDSGAVTYAKIQNVSATDKLLGRSTAGAGVIEEISCTAFGRSVLAGADASAARTTINAVSKSGDTISGAVTVTGALTGSTGLNISGGRSYFQSNDSQYGVGAAYGSGGGYVYFGAVSASATPDAVISNAGGGSLLYIQNGGNVGIGTTSPAVKVDVSGAIRASSGIRFGTDTASANTLADYEEGTYTPSFVSGFSSVTVSSVMGRYIKIGKSVTAHIRIGVTAFTGNSSVVGVSLPFTASSSTVGGGVVHFATGLATGATSPPMLYGPDSTSSTASLLKTNSEGFTASDFNTPPWTLGLTVLYTAD